eukprot:TRINITY_DN19724_c0_g1_i1.p1 TRINITY_DN19724_c0_g1~~TRINITY_DN19724_c0_g1_i1.p1  ORF type:complete len:158 (-),score=12.88 TRINITY_DN19724_c0_g1_i1:314-787(-)
MIPCKPPSRSTDHSPPPQHMLAPHPPRKGYAVTTFASALDDDSDYSGGSWWLRRDVEPAGEGTSAGSSAETSEVFDPWSPLGDYGHSFDALAAIGAGLREEPPVHTELELERPVLVRSASDSSLDSHDSGLFEFEPDEVCEEELENSAAVESEFDSG